MRSTGAIASFLAYYFELIFDNNVILINTTSPSSTYEHIFRITEEDVMIGISFPRYSVPEALTQSRSPTAWRLRWCSRRTRY